MSAFAIDLRGLIDLLSNHLYGDPSVFVRELLQNAVDAWTARQRATEACPSCAIRFVLTSGRSLEVHDTGVGMTRAELEEFVATIGRSSKRLSQAPDAYLGQFGIGLLACFVVSDTIEIVTRSATASDAPTLRWVGHASGTYEITEVDPLPSPGSVVRLTAKPGHDDVLSADEVGAALKRYGEFLPCEVILEAAGRAIPVHRTPPWAQTDETAYDRRERLMGYADEWFGDAPIDVIPLRSEAGGVEGIAYVLGRETRSLARRVDRVYLKGMHLSDAVDGILPEWAFFVRAVFNVRDLKPLASRESLVEDATLAEAREVLGASLRAYIEGLAERDPARLQSLLRLHHRAVKRLAAEDDTFLQMIGPWLPFRTTSGPMRLGRIATFEGGISVARTVDLFRQLAPIAAAQGRLLINAGYVDDVDVLSRYQRLTGIELEWESAGDMVERFDELDLAQRRATTRLRAIANEVLAPFRCEVEVRRFAPAELPAMYVSDADNELMRDVEAAQARGSNPWTTALTELPATDAHAELVLNFGNPLIMRLALVDDDALMRHMIEMLYVNTLLLGQHRLNTSEMDLISSALSGVIEWSLMRDDRMLQ